jgi:hypothetical protein
MVGNDDDAAWMPSMANEELVQRGYLKSGKLKGEAFGAFEFLDLGATSVRELGARHASHAAQAAIRVLGR